MTVASAHTHPLPDAPGTYITRFRHMQNSRGVNNKTVATQLHVQNSHVAEWATGKRPIPTHHLMSLCKWWRCPPRALVGWVNIDIED